MTDNQRMKDDQLMTDDQLMPLPSAQVVNFPAFIVCDDKGNDFFAEFGM